jgi:hypothetical protein
LEKFPEMSYIEFSVISPIFSGNDSSGNRKARGEEEDE